MTLRPLNLTLARSAIRDGVTLIRSGHTAAGLRLIEHGEQYLAGFVVHEVGALAAPRRAIQVSKAA